MNAEVIYQMPQAGTSSGRIFIGVFFLLLLGLFCFSKIKVKSYTPQGESVRREE